MTSEQPPVPASARRPVAPLLLLLGGTPQARRLAEILEARFAARLQVLTIDAGDREARAGLDEAAAFAAFLDARRVGIVVDAMGASARRIRAAARAGALLARTPLITLRHPPWPRDPRDRWIEVADPAAARQAMRRLARRFLLTVDPDDLPAFAGLDNSFLVVRLAKPPAAPLPFEPGELICAPGPFRVEEELKLLRSRRIGVLVTRSGGGRPEGARIAAARHLGLPVVIIHRDEPGVVLADTPLAVSDRIAGLLAPTAGGA